MVEQIGRSLDNRIIFVVGNSRSGTTLMGRILGQHAKVFTFHELHFFEQQWKPTSAFEQLSKAEAKRLAAKLLSIQRDGYFNEGDPREYYSESASILSLLGDQGYSPANIFSAFLNFESKLKNKSIACDQTPRNIYYIKEILNLYPNAQVVNMVRDPRDVLLSQRKKWRRRMLGGRSLPRREMFRSWANYHPITISMIWNSGIQAGMKSINHPRVIRVYFEELVSDPENIVRGLCEFFALEFSPEMLQVPQVGSSHAKDNPQKEGINSAIAGQWRQESNNTDLVVCQWITKKYMLMNNYHPAAIRPNMISLVFILITWPFKTLLAFLLNFRRTRSIGESIKKRIGL